MHEANVEDSQQTYGCAGWPESLIFNVSFLKAWPVYLFVQNGFFPF